MKLIAIAAASVLLMAGAAQAQQARQVGGTYAELGYTQFKFSGDNATSAKPSALRGIVGYDVHQNVAIEGMLAFGVSDDQGLKLNHAYGVYVKPKVNVAEALELFGRLGYARVKGTGGGESTTEGGASYGIGANYKFSPTTYVGVDYMRYFKKDGISANGLTVGVGFRF